LADALLPEGAFWAGSGNGIASASPNMNPSTSLALKNLAHRSAEPKLFAIGIRLLAARRPACSELRNFMVLYLDRHIVASIIASMIASIIAQNFGIGNRKFFPAQKQNQKNPPARRDWLAGEAFLKLHQPNLVRLNLFQAGPRGPNARVRRSPARLSGWRRNTPPQEWSHQWRRWWAGRHRPSPARNCRWDMP